eukprot:15347887-Ditylum_brightwellii.AAC.1
MLDLHHHKEASCRKCNKDKISKEIIIPWQNNTIVLIIVGCTVTMLDTSTPVKHASNLLQGTFGLRQGKTQWAVLHATATRFGWADLDS